MPPRPVTSSPSREAMVEDEMPPSLRVPRPDELVLTILPTEAEAMIGTSHVRLFKGTAVGNIVHATRSVTWHDTSIPPTYEVEVEGGEVIQVILSPSRNTIGALSWVWDRL